MSHTYDRVERPYNISLCHTYDAWLPGNESQILRIQLSWKEGVSVMPYGIENSFSRYAHERYASVFSWHDL
jgi:hypothetical protein